MKDLNSIYHEDDFNRPLMPYAQYRRSLEDIVDFAQIESFADFGCINGKLMESIKRKYPHIAVCGYDVFQWSKKYADPLVKESINIVDLRKKQSDGRAFDFVNCTEVGEHIDREYEDEFIENLTSACRGFLVLSWSDEINPQHFNPRPASYIKQQVEKKGFSFLSRQTSLLRKALRKNVNEYGHQWWSESVCVYARKQNNMHAKYVLLGTINQEPSSLKSYRNPWLTRESLQEQFLSLTSMIKEKVSLRKPFSLVRFGDGDFFFLMRMAKGSARPGRRGSLKPYNLIDSSKYRYNFLANEEFGLELQIAYRIKYLLYLFIHWPFFNRFFWKSLLRRRGVAGRVMKNHIKLIRESIFGPKTSFETIYGLVANRWIFREFKDGISLIGSEKKIELIKNLMDHSEYRQYLGVEKFEQYIGIPEKGAADEPESILEEIGLEIQNSNTRIFLVGMGHGKTYLISALRKYTDAVIIDVGTGIDALAGCINHERPYFADWVNFRFKDFDYSAIDQMDYDSHKRDRNKYKTIWI